MGKRVGLFLVILLGIVFLCGSPVFAKTKVAFALLWTIDDMGWTTAHYRGIEYLKKELGDKIAITSSLSNLGIVYQMKGDHDKATEYLKRSLKLSEKIKSQYGVIVSLFYLVLLHVDKNSREEAIYYLKKMEKLSDQTENSIFKQGYLIAKALLLKQSNRIRNRTEAEIMLKKIIEGGFTADRGSRAEFGRCPARGIIGDSRYCAFRA